MATEYIPIAESGMPVGEHHPNAKLTDAQVDEMRDLNEEGIGYRQLAKRFNTSLNTVKDICTYRRRNTFAARHKRRVVRD